VHALQTVETRCADNPSFARVIAGLEHEICPPATTTPR
jgi:hypothetical protein